MIRKLTMILLIIILPTISFGSSELSKGKIKDAFIDKEIDLQPQISKSLVGFGIVNGIKYYYTKSVNRIFLASKSLKASITDFDFDDEQVIIDMNSKIFGRGKIIIKFDESYDEKINTAQMIDIVNNVVNGNTNDVICDKSTKLCHMINSNHYESNGEITKYRDINQSGSIYKKCGFCFESILHLTDGELEDSIGSKLAGHVRHYSPVNMNDDVQKRVNKIGQMVISNWPLKLMGYDYAFRVVDNKQINALAVPAGQIFINSGLINALENDNELEAVLAHEVAHVEMRHSLRQHYESIKKQNAQAGMAAVGAIAGAMAGAASAGNNNMPVSVIQSSAALGGLIGGLGGYTVAEIFYNGYSKELEREADELSLLYFKINKRDKKTLRNILNKFSYHTLTVRHDPDPKSKTHPQIFERLNYVDSVQLNYINKSYFIKDKNDNMHQITFLYESKYNDSQYLYAFISSVPSKASEHFSHSIIISTDEGKFKYGIGDSLVSSYDLGNIIRLIPDKKLPLSSITDVEFLISEKDPNYGYPNDKSYKMKLGTLDGLL